MFKSLCRLIFRKMGWQVVMTVPYRDKCIICVAPHTSNWDFIIAELYYHSIGRTAGFLLRRPRFYVPLRSEQNKHPPDVLLPTISTGVNSGSPCPTQ